MVINEMMKTNRNLHPDDVEYFEHIKTLTFQCAAKYQLPLKQVVPSNVPHPAFLGWCSSEGTIKIALRPRRKGVWGSRRSDETIAEIVAHELAHLMYHGHGEDHTEFTKKIKDFILFRKE